MPNLLPEQTITPAGQPTLLLPPPLDLFASRGERLHGLSPHHTLGPWLTHLAAVCEVQQSALNALLAEQAQGKGTRLSLAVPVEAATLEAVAAVYGMLLDKLADAPVAQGSPAPAAPPQALSQEELALAAERCLLLAHAQTDAAGRTPTDVLVAAAMQVVWTAAARQADPAGMQPGHADFCPVCASAAGGSIVLAGEGRGGLRYQQCCLCSSRWNVVRAHCTLCEEGSTVNYLSLEGENPAIGAETCEHCHGYAKIFFQDKDRHVDPVADDLATLALDVLVGEEGFGRGAPNLFLCEGDAA